MTRTTTRLAFALALSGLAAGCIIQNVRSNDEGGEGPTGPTGNADNAAAKSTGCITCHTGLEQPSMHKLAQIGCAECHGGNASATSKEAAHVQPAFPEEWARPGRQKTYALLNREKLAFVRFINPGDLRVVRVTCGRCHEKEAANVPVSIMAHSAMVPGSGLYNNGALPYKRYLVGEFYMPDGSAAHAKAGMPATDAEKDRGIVDVLYSYPRWETAQPGNIFRVLERGIPNTRGLGTQAKIDAVFLTANKTRLNDPNLWLTGTNDYAGEFRSSGCTACHVTYANDETAASGPYAKFGRKGTATSNDPTIPKDEPGHPISHALTRRIPSSQCLTCHIHQGSGAIANYVGVEWWDGETDGELAYKENGELKHGAELADIDRDNSKAKVARFTGHHRSGWSFRKIFKQDLQGNLIGRDGKVVDYSDPDWEKKAVHLEDAHFKAGMHCIDCHTHQDAHGDGKLYYAMIDAVEITCIDCHGTITERATLRTSNPSGGSNLRKARTASGKPWFEGGEEGKPLVQNSKVDDNLSWEVPQLVDLVDPSSKKYNKKAAIAKTLEKDGKHWGDASSKDIAHSNDALHCYACHSSWTVTCGGCHLAQKVNARTKLNHYWGETTKNDIAYYSQGLRHDCFVLGVTGVVQKNKIGPVRSASAVAATTEDGNRAIVTHQQPTISGAGYSGTAFSPFIPHTVDQKDAKACTSCHVSKDEDNNAVLATLFAIGAHGSDFVGGYVHVATGESGVAAVKVTEGWEPQPVIGSAFHKILHPDSAAKFEASNRILDEMHAHRSSNAKSVQLRGEYLFIADGPGGFRVFDVANIANKNVAQRIVSAPFSPLGHDAHVATKDATAVLLPTTVPMDPRRQQDKANLERPVNPLFGYAFVLDSQEGLVVVDVNTFVDGDPENNFLSRTATFDGGGKLMGARAGVVAGNYLYVLTPSSLVVVDVSDPLSPKVSSELTLNDPRGIEVQFRYAAVVDADGMKVLDVTDLAKPQWVKEGFVALPDARGIRISRTYAYVAAGREGLAIIDVKKFRSPKLVEKFTGEGQIDDACAVVTGNTNASSFAYVADGKNGLRVIELVTPSRQPRADGFAPPPMPRLIATRPLSGRAIALSTGAQRDRGVDESGNQLSVFGRLGSRPLDLAERQRFYLRNGQTFTVSDDGEGLEERDTSSSRAQGQIKAIEAEIEEVKKKLEDEKNPVQRRNLNKKLKDLEKELADAKEKTGKPPEPKPPEPPKPPTPANAEEIAAIEKELQAAKAELEAMLATDPKRKALKAKVAGLEKKLADAKAKGEAPK